MGNISQPFGQKLTAGDRWKWTVTLADYPADTWRLKYFFRGASKLDVVSAPASAGSTDHLLDTLPADTLKLQPGVYGWQARVVSIADATESYELARGTVEVLADIQSAGADGPVDFRTQNRRTLDNVRKVIEGTATREEKQYQVGGRSLEVRTYDELRAMEADYSNRVAKEEIAAGTRDPNSNMVHVRFGCPR